MTEGGHHKMLFPISVGRLTSRGGLEISCLDVEIALLIRIAAEERQKVDVVGVTDVACFSYKEPTVSLLQLCPAPSPRNRGTISLSTPVHPVL